MSKRSWINNSGVAATEMAVVLPFIALLFFGVFDLGQALFSSGSLVQIANEGVKTGSQLSGIKAASNESFQNVWCYENESECKPSGQILTECADVSYSPTCKLEHWVVQRRIRSLLSEVAKIPSGQITTIESGFVKTTRGDNVSVKITGTYPGTIPFMNGIPFEVEHMGPYLYGDSRFSYKKPGSMEGIDLPGEPPIGGGGGVEVGGDVGLTSTGGIEAVGVGL
ncbi:pilus assembly protein [bacterium]|nr:pilus assembly protein [bacterium]